MNRLQKWWAANILDEYCLKHNEEKYALHPDGSQICDKCDEEDKRI